eukprot:11744821-Karenia_brevis.AAC.1
MECAIRAAMVVWVAQACAGEHMIASVGREFAEKERLRRLSAHANGKRWMKKKKQDDKNAAAASQRRVIFY